MKRGSFVGMFLVAVLLVGPVHAQSVLVVDASGGGDFTALQAAVDAASTGDVLLIRPTTSGTYGMVTIAGKGLTLVGDGATRPRVGTVTVSDLTAPASVTLRFLDVLGSVIFTFGTQHLPGMRLEGDDGLVFVEDVVCRGLVGGPEVFIPPDGTTGITVAAGVRAVLVGADVEGGQGKNAFAPNPFESYPASAGGAALVIALGAQVSLWDCNVDGGRGGSPALNTLGDVGGDGITTSGTVLLSLCAVAGGANLASFTSGSDGVQADAGQVLHLGSRIQAGAGGVGGEALDLAPGVDLRDLDAAGRILTVPSPVRESEVIDVHYLGEVGDLVAVFLSGASSWVAFPFLDGAFHLADLQGPVLVGVVGSPSGELTLPTLIEELPPGWELLTAFAQGYAIDAGGAAHLTSPSSVIVVDASF